MKGYNYMKAASFDEARLMDTQLDQRVEELDAAKTMHIVADEKEAISNCRQARIRHATSAPSMHRQHASA